MIKKSKCQFCDIRENLSPAESRFDTSGIEVPL